MKKPKKIHLQSIRPANRFSRANLTVFAIIFAAIGGYLIYSSFAAGFTTSFEAENSTKNSPATTVSDAGASGGSALKFQAGGSGSCTLPAYPDATCTGVPAGTSLTTLSGDQIITTDGAVIDSKNINGCVEINANNVTIKNTKINCRADISVGNFNGGVYIDPGKTGFIIQDSELDCSNGLGSTALGPSNYTALRINIDGCENGAWAENNVTIRDSYIHDIIPYDPTTDPHTDGIQLPENPPGALNVTIDHNRIYGNYVNSTSFGSSALQTKGGANIHITNNLLAGGGDSLRCQGAAGSTNFVVTGNRFSTIFVSTVGGFGPTDGFCKTTATTYSDNVYYDGPNTGNAVE